MIDPTGWLVSLDNNSKHNPRNHPQRKDPMKGEKVLELAILHLWGIVNPF